MDKLKHVALARLEGTICEAYCANWYFVQELWCRLLGKTYTYQCGHRTKRTVLRLMHNKLHACMLIEKNQAGETLCADCSIAADEEARRRIHRIVSVPPEEKFRANFLIAAEKATDLILEIPEVKESPEKAAGIAEALQKLKDGRYS